jgi:hypothetical protein
MPVSEPVHNCQVNRSDDVRKPELGGQVLREGRIRPLICPRHPWSGG